MTTLIDERKRLIYDKSERGINVTILNLSAFRQNENERRRTDGNAPASVAGIPIAVSKYTQAQQSVILKKQTVERESDEIESERTGAERSGNVRRIDDEKIDRM